MDTNTPEVSSLIVRVCTFNLHYGYDDHGTPNAWDKRRIVLKKCLKNMQPSIMGTQEGYPPQLYDVLEDLNLSSKCWSWIGEKLDDWRKINAIFYRHDLFSLISTTTFWYNEHPDTSGAAWGANSPRGCTRGQFEHIATKQPFIIYNTHLDYPCQNARHHSIPVLLSQIKENGDYNDKVIVTGDFNNWPETTDGDTSIGELIRLGQKASEIEQMKAASFVDTYQHGETPTFNGFRTVGYGPKIDFIWISSNSVYRVEGETKVDDYHDDDGYFPSDHFPVYADLIYTS
ncbi:unnamed protein product [Rotaria magnacalcarata]|uniref:Endonuclease/exonuclease/phosphatase domain-containing protein n=2 Tax=Rotaria magnacalcarata TaxID=392030 RepID=A0A816ZSW2_9BILA|nr:unnamed protein product [Rotaria magnacalcarata]CAF2223689.1 unnamed protein product [Rotaria magnacalcarata]CAF4138707.1 unnamed protein product [Rotaria magnacalcarata]CAF4198894.1 unnamed protein product [Rotaria magnacalcarata]